MSAICFAKNVVEWNSKIPAFHSWLKTLSPTAHLVVQIDDAVSVFHQVRLIFSTKGLKTVPELLTLMVDDFGPLMNLDLDENCFGYNGLHYTSLLKAWWMIFNRWFNDWVNENIYMSRENLINFKTWVTERTENCWKVADYENPASIVTLLGCLNMHSATKIAETGRKLFRVTTLQEGYVCKVINSRLWFEGARRIFDYKPEKDCDLPVPIPIDSPRPSSLRQKRREEARSKRGFVPYYTTKETNYNLVFSPAAKRNPLKRCNALTAEEWEEETRGKPKKLKLFMPLDLSCDEILDDAKSEEEEVSDCVEDGETEFTMGDVMDAEDMYPTLSKEDQLEKARKIFKCKQEIDAGWIRCFHASRMVSRMSVDDKRVFVFVKTEDEKFDEELGNKIREVVRNHRRVKIDLNKTQVVPYEEITK